MLLFNMTSALHSEQTSDEVDPQTLKEQATYGKCEQTVVLCMQGRWGYVLKYRETCLSFTGIMKARLALETLVYT